MDSSSDSTTEQLSSRIDNLRGSIWTNLTATARHQHIAEMDEAWGGRGWVPPWPRPDGSYCTVENLPSTDILDLASITRFCTQHNARLSSLWEVNGILAQMAECASPGASPMWSQDSGAQAVLEVYSILSSQPRSDSSLLLRDAGRLQGDDTVFADQGPRKRPRVSVSDNITQASTATPAETGSINEALEEARHLQQTLQSFMDTLCRNLERIPLEGYSVMKSDFERIQNDAGEAQAECANADAEVKSCEEAYRSLQQGSNATASRYNILKEWLEPFLLVNQVPHRAHGGAASSTAPHDPELQDAMEAVSREARQTLENYCGAMSGEDTLQSLRRVLDQVQAASTRQQEARLALSEAQNKLDQMKAKLELASQRALLTRMMRETADMVDARRG